MFPVSATIAKVSLRSRVLLTALASGIEFHGHNDTGCAIGRSYRSSFYPLYKVSWVTTPESCLVT